MNKFISFFAHNWLLKLISLILAIVLYLSLREEPPKSHKNNGRSRPRTDPINRSYETMTNTILKALNTAKATEESGGEETEPTKSNKKVSGQKNAK